jgi:DnaJ homolog subfamily B member 13
MGVDYYAVLNVNRNASIWEIRIAYRALALQLHPHREQYQQHPNPRPPGVFDLPLPALPENIYWELINEAYDVLSHELRREIYNQYGEEGLKRGIAVPNGFIPPYIYHKDCMRTYYEFFGSYSPYADIIDAVTKPPPLYTVNQGRGVMHKEPDVINLLPLTLENIYHGCLKNFHITRMEFVDEFKNRTEPKEVVLSIQIKPGTLAGTKIIFHNAGDQSVTRTPADYMYVTTDEPHEVFRRDKWDLHMNYKITLKEALTGFKMNIGTLDDRNLSVSVTDVVK